MLQIAEKKANIQPILEYGTVLGMCDDGFRVRSAYGDYTARVAVSCLVRPGTSDVVLLALDNEDDSFILSVLRRGDEAPAGTDLVFDGPLHFRVENGPMSLLADEGVAIASPREIAITSEKMQIRAKLADITVERLSVLGSFLHSRIKEMKIVSGRVEEIFQRLTQRLTDTFRFVKEHEEVQTGTSRYLVEKTLTMHSKNAMHVAEEMVTINAEQINMG
ncbi:MAG: hypothetical protein CSYNP_02363 [Syntrophus sp. SKADARSKE-3]|nr:hypothetical protein [Syntrophus sp. SKADARSKE-3]